MPDRQPTTKGAPLRVAPQVKPCPTGVATRSSHAESGDLRGVDKATADGKPIWGRRRVLLLNATYEPLTALPLRRAIVLLICGKAEVVHGDPAGLVLHSASEVVLVPSVIRLSTFVRVPYRGRVPMTRAALMYRDRYRCAYCGGRAETIDHVVPRSRGGPHTWENCVACCAKCNHRKADKQLAELGWRLRVVPRAPRGRYWRLLASISEADPLWLPYLDEAA
ncbi:HNH endonuclease [Allokutzneria sp. NRRL B-24872]|uniref:HNH endonuclease n=1 Tax=Allokutzneria sp. NRRL B-24872 TaxID=1137961 RepID=UPI001AEFEAC2